jgi:hypothetical protein
MMTSTNRSSPMEATDADRLRELAREVELRAAGRDDVAHFAAWVRTRLDVLAEQLTPAHRSSPGVAKAPRREAPTLH